jgi:hypothetical protein
MQVTSFVDKIHAKVQPSIYKTSKIPPVMVSHPIVGQMGIVDHKGFRPQGIRTSQLDAILRDEERYMWSAAYRKIVAKRLARESGAITSWSSVLSQRAAGYSNDFVGVKASQTTVANNWSMFARSTGVPGAIAYSNIPTGAVCTNLTSGAVPIASPGSSSVNAYLLNFGTNHQTGTNIVMLIDLLVAAGNILATSGSAQTVSSAALTRYTTGAGVYMTYDVTTPLGSTAQNLTASYTNQAGASGQSTGAQAMTASCIAFRTQPIISGFACPLQAGDYGVRTVSTVTMSATNSAGAFALLLFYPLMIIPTLATTSWVEKPISQVVAQLAQLQSDASYNTACLTFYVLTSTTSTGVQTFQVTGVIG